MKQKGHDMSVRELFRQKLENAEVSPGPAVDARIMKALGRKEFFRFNPARFNVYYLGAVAAAAISAGILLFSEKGKDPAGEMMIGTPADTVSQVLTIPEGKALYNVPKENTAARAAVIIKETASRLKSDRGTTQQDVRISNEAVPGDLGDKLTGKELSVKPNEINRLQTLQTIPENLFEASSYSGCPPLKVHFRSNAGSYSSISWNFGDGGSSSERDPVWLYDDEGEYRVVLNVTGPDGVARSSSALVTVYQKPQARFETYPDKATIPDDAIQFLNYSAGALKFRWDFGDGSTSDLIEPKYKYNRYGRYNVKLVVLSEHGCSDSVTVANAFSGSEYFIEMPNAFIPNQHGPSGGFYSSKSDESAEIFHPECSGVSNYQLRIFSKIGVLLFETNDINTGWDGYFKGQLCNPGVYIWKIRGTFRNGEPFTKMGDVTLLRN